MRSEPNRPGCFGFVTTYDASCPHCKSCLEFDACGTHATVTRGKLQRLLKYRDSTESTPMHTDDEVRSSSVDAVAVAIVNEHLKASPITTFTTTNPGNTSTVLTYVGGAKGMSKKARALHDSMLRRGVDWTELPAGKNPLLKETKDGSSQLIVGPTYLNMVVVMLLQGAPVTNVALRDLFARELRWSKGTASSHVGIAQSLLTALHIVTVKDGVWTRVT
mgnify:CR=1 FL=1